MIICEYCSAKNKSDDLECRKCGAPLKIDVGREIIGRYLLMNGEYEYDFDTPGGTAYLSTSCSCDTYNLVADIDDCHMDRARDAAWLKQNGFASDEWIRKNVLS